RVFGCRERRAWRKGYLASGRGVKPGEAAGLGSGGLGLAIGEEAGRRGQLPLAEFLRIQLLLDFPRPFRFESPTLPTPLHSPNSSAAQFPLRIVRLNHFFSFIIHPLEL